MIHRFLLCIFLFSLVVSLASSAQPEQSSYDGTGESWSWGFGSEEGGGGSSYLGVDIADVSPERLGELKLKEEHGAEVTMVDQDAPAGKAGLHEHDVIVSLNGTAVESAAQLRRMIKETPAGRVVTLGISRDGQPLTIKVPLADRHKSMTWAPKSGEFKFEMPQMPTMPDFDVPVSVVIVHSSLRSGLMVENITPQLGDFFGVKGGNGVLVRSVDRAVEAMPFVVHVGLQRAKQPVPLAVLRPAIEPIEHGLPRAELLGQVSPWRSRSPPPKHRFDEVPIIVTGFANRVVGLQEALDLRPLCVVQLPSCAHALAAASSAAPGPTSRRRRVQGQALD